jgi:hypothetical protein
VNVYRDALLVQDASNPSGIARSLVEVIDAIKAEPEYDGTDYVCSHPAFVLFASKLESLAGYGHRYSEAYAECRRRAGEVA